MTTQADKVRSVSRQMFKIQVELLTQDEREAIDKALKDMSEALPKQKTLAPVAKPIH